MDKNLPPWGANFSKGGFLNKEIRSLLLTTEMTPKTFPLALIPARTPTRTWLLFLHG